MKIHTLSIRFMNFAYRLTGYSAAELAGMPWKVQHRRLMLGLLVMGSAGFAAVMLILALARIDPSNAWRWPMALMGGVIYCVMLAGFDSLFVSSAESAHGKAAWARIILSLIMTAFSSITLDAVIAGNRLEAEIDLRRADANLTAQAKHNQVFELDARNSQFDRSADRVKTLVNELESEPQSVAYQDAVARESQALEAYARASKSAEPRLEQLRAAIAEIRSQVGSTAGKPAEDRPELMGRLAQLRAQRESLERNLQDLHRVANARSEEVAELKRQWRTERQLSLNQARSDQNHARSELAKSRELAQEAMSQSLAINARSFEVNVVEEMTAYWALAARDKGYLAIGIAVWMGALVMELLAILTKILLKPDILDLTSRNDSKKRAMESDGEVRAWELTKQANLVQSESARLQAQTLIAVISHKQSLSETASRMVIDAFVRLQERKRDVDDPRVSASLDRHFDRLQALIDEELEQAWTAASGVSAASRPAAESSPAPSTDTAHTAEPETVCL